MVVKRKKTLIDGMDREILRQMLENKRPLTGFQLAKKIGLSPSAVRPRLDNLQDKGIVKPVKILGMREFPRTFEGKSKPVNIKAPRSISWGLDLKPDKKKK